MKPSVKIIFYLQILNSISQGNISVPSWLPIANIAVVADHVMFQPLCHDVANLTYVCYLLPSFPRKMLVAEEKQCQFNDFL